MLAVNIQLQLVAGCNYTHTHKKAIYKLATGTRKTTDKCALVLTPCTRSHVTAALTTGTVAGIGGVLRAKAGRKRTRGQSRSRSRTRSPCCREAEGRSEHSTADEGVEDQSGGIGCLLAYVCAQILIIEPKSLSPRCRGTPCNWVLLALIY